MQSNFLVKVLYYKWFDMHVLLIVWFVQSTLSLYDRMRPGNTRRDCVLTSYDLSV